MPKRKESTPEFTKPEPHEQLIRAIENIAFSIDVLKNYQPKDNSEILMNIFISLNKLDKIQHEIHLLNKTLIMSTLILSATKDPEKTLNEYHKIIEQYLQ